MSLRYAILGFLSFRELSGYELKKAFDQSVRHFWPADQSQIYRTLSQLHAEGLVTQEVIPREERLDMKRYGITEAGRGELLAWLATPLPAQETRDPALIQLYFSGLISDEALIAVLEHSIREIDGLLELYQALYRGTLERARAAGDARAFARSMMTLEYGIQANRWYRGWLLSVIDRVRRGDTTLLPFDEIFPDGE